MRTSQQNSQGRREDRPQRGPAAAMAAPTCVATQRSQADSTGRRAGVLGSRPQAAQRAFIHSVQASPRSVAQRRRIQAAFGDAARRGPAAAGAAQPVMQRYSLHDGDVMLSEKKRFAVQGEGHSSKMFVADDVVLPEFQHLELKRSGERRDVADVTLKGVAADYEEQDEMARMYCGQYSEMVTGIKENRENETALPGRSLYVNKLFDIDGSYKGAWENHYAPVVVADKGDRGTLETAAGIEHIWFGIYGKQRGQSFRYKTAVADVKLQLRRKRISSEEALEVLKYLAKYAAEGVPSEEAVPEQVLKEILDIEEALISAAELGDQEWRQTELPSVKEAREQRDAEKRDARLTEIVKAVRDNTDGWRDQVLSEHRYSMNFKIREALKQSGQIEEVLKRLKEAQEMTQVQAAISSQSMSGGGSSESSRSGPSFIQVIGGAAVLAILGALLWLAKSKG